MSDPHAWHLALFGRSVLKQQKFAEIQAFLGSTKGLRCLDLGSDNGVVSFLLRQQGGDWASADLTPEAVHSIRKLVKADVHHIQEDHLPFRDAEFDCVVVVDMLEHVSREGVFISELARIIKPGGRLILNTPHLRQTLLRRLRHALGQTDEKHGHLRPGYTAQSLQILVDGIFTLNRVRTYSRFFSEVVDTAMQLGMERLGKKGSAKGIVVTQGDLQKHRQLFWIYSILYPFVWLFSRLDRLVPWAEGYMLIAQATRIYRAS